MVYPANKETMPQRDTGQTILKDFFNVYSNFLDSLQELLGYGVNYLSLTENLFLLDGKEIFLDTAKNTSVKYDSGNDRIEIVNGSNKLFVGDTVLINGSSVNSAKVNSEQNETRLNIGNGIEHKVKLTELEYYIQGVDTFEDVAELNIVNFAFFKVFANFQMDQEKQAVLGTIKIKYYEQAGEPSLNQDSQMVMWKDTDDSDRVYLVFRRGSGDQLKVELT